MSDPIEERLGRLMPAGSALDRTALLFAAGRASAWPNRSWQALAGALAALQVVTLALLWPHPSAAPNSGPAPQMVDVAPTPHPPAEPSSLLVQRALAIQSDGDWPLPTATDTTTTLEEPLHVFSPPPDSLLN
jgi:hypothetical protein